MIVAAIPGATVTRFDDGFVNVDPVEERFRRELQKPQEWAVGEMLDDRTERRYETVEPGTAAHFRACVLKVGGSITIDDGDS